MAAHPKIRPATILTLPFNELAGNGFLVQADQTGLALVPRRTAGT